MMSGSAGGAPDVAVASRGPTLSPLAAIPSGVTAIALVMCGLGIARGGITGYLSIGTAVGIALFALFGKIRFPALIAWVAVTVIVFPFARFPSSDALVTFDRVWIAAMASCFLSANVAPKSSTATRFLFGSLASLVVAYGVRALLSPGDQWRVLAEWVDAILLPVVLFAVSHRLTTTPDRCARLGGALCFAGGVLAVIGIAEWWLGFELASRSGGIPRLDLETGAIRVAGPYIAPEPYAVSLVLCLAGTIYWTITRRRHMLGTVIVLLELWAIGLTLFRAAWIAAVAVVVVTLGMRPRRAGRALVTMATVGVVVVLLFGQLGDNPTVSRRVENTENITGRIAVYGVAIDLFGASPLIGVGVGQFVAAQSSLGGSSLTGARYVQYPHSSYMAVLAEQGLLGFVPLVLVTVATWCFVRRLRRAAGVRDDEVFAAAVAAAAVGYFFISLTLTMLPYGSSNAFFAVLLGAGARRLDALVDEQETQDAPTTHGHRAAAVR